MRARLALLIAVPVVAVLVFVSWRLYSARHANPAPAAATSPSNTPAAAQQPNTTSGSAPTNIYAHNLLLRKGPNFRVYIRWLRGQFTRAHRNVTPSFDDPESFFINIKTGVLRANIGDIGHLLDSGAVANSPLKNITLAALGNQLKLNGTLHKVIPLPIELIGTVAMAPANRIQVHVTKLDVLKIPLKGLLRDFHLTLADLFHPKNIAGVTVSGNDIFFDPAQLLPPPHIRGQLTAVRVASPDLEEVYGNAQSDVQRVEQWRNFLRLRDGSVDFGKLTMHHVDIIMIDISNDAWFDLDLAHYQEQFVNGYTRMTPQAGLQIFMPDVDELPHTKTNQNISIEWLKNRNLPPPPDVTSGK